jgi:hypothetical protein
MKFKITTNICLRKRLEYSILLMGVFNYLLGKGTVTDTVCFNMTTVRTVPIDLTLEGNDTAVSAENNESSHVIPQDVAINTTEEIRVSVNMTRVGTAPIGLTLAGNDTAISGENNESTQVIPQDVAINTTEEIRLILPDKINVIPKNLLLIPKELSEENFTTYRECYDSLVQFCGSKGFGPRYFKSKENKQNKIHQFRCEFGKLRNGTRKQSSTNTHDKNRECPWR